MANHCPLCGDSRSRLRDRYSFDQIWEALHLDHCARFTPDLRNRLTPADKTDLLQCITCGLEYFSPAIAGDGESYRLLTEASASYYNSDTWDFRKALEISQSSGRLLDVACGAGAFLALARTHGLEVHGVESNPAAVSLARTEGLNVDLIDIGPFAAQHFEQFDLVTVFQVVEHLKQVVPFTIEASRCLKPGGQLLLSVPNRFRVWRSPFEPLDCPPHHLSRWAPEQLSTLAALTGLQLKAIHYQVASPDHCRNALRRWLFGERQRRLPIRIFAKILINRFTLPEWISSDLLAKLHLHNHGMLAVLVKPTR